MIATVEKSPRPSIRGPYRTELVRTEEELRALKPAWARLYAASAPRNPFLSYEWVAACAGHVCPNAEPFVLTVWAEDQLIGVAPLRRERHRGFRVLRFLGKGLSPYVGFLVSPEHETMDEILLEALAGARHSWDLLQLTQLADPFTRLHHVQIPGSLRGASRPSSWKGASYVAFPGDWEELRRSGIGWLKEGHKRVARFEREGGTTQRYVGSEAAARIDEVIQVEAHSWQARYGQWESPATHGRVMNLIQEALDTLGAHGEMELWIARFGGEPIAHEINFLTADRIWLYRGGYHEDYARLGAGVVLDYLSVRRAWREGRREFDYLSGGEPYKVQRTNAVRPVRQMFLHPRTPRGFAAFALLLAPRAVLEQTAPTRAALRVLARWKNSPKSLLPGAGVVRSRVQ